MGSGLTVTATWSPETHILGPRRPLLGPPGVGVRSRGAYLDFERYAGAWAGASDSSLETLAMWGRGQRPVLHAREMGQDGLGRRMVPVVGGRTCR